MIIISIDKIVQEIYDIIQQMSKIFERKNLSFNQQSIMLKQQINNLKSKFNSISLSSLNTNEKSKITEELLRKITDFYFYESENLNNNLIGYEIQILRMRLITDLMEFWGEGGVLRLQGTANAFANMLIGFDKLQIEDMLMEKDDPQFLSRFQLIFNYINFFAGIYYIASCNLYSIPQEDFFKFFKFVK